ncbi:MFS transporter [Halanaerobiaceae bacterium Z-7014]|uniref:MFS transporter n=1 Tax=Halonatronomonas betaini TaxID=2778430 RepID=A0A931B044_9FIRM|nr:MFS transporter [Halonatronomonas betaini]MBF8437963.1 MFS transporter [Halonatronomonas betaini]
MLNKIDELKNGLQWKLLFILSTGYMGAFINIQGIQSLMPFIQDDFGISRTEAGLYSTFLFLSATGVAIFSGNIVDKVGSKKTLLFGIFSIGFLMLAHTISPVYSIILILAFITGIGFSIITPAVNKSIMDEVKPENRGLSMGLMHSGSGIGGFAGATLLPILAISLGWRGAILISSLLTIALGIFVKKAYNPDTSLNNNDNNSDASFKDNILELLKNKQLILTCSLGLIFGLAVGSIPAHYTLFLTTDLGYSSSLAGFALGVVQIGGIFGRTLWGWVSDSIFKGDRTISFILIMLIIILLNLSYGFFGDMLASSQLIILAISFLLGLTAFGWSGLYFTVVGERVRSEQTGIASGLSLIFLRTGVVVGPPLFGLLADQYDHYHNSWIFLAGLVFVSGAIYYYLQNKENKKPDHKRPGK